MDLVRGKYRDGLWSDKFYVMVEMEMGERGPQGACHCKMGRRDGGSKDGSSSSDIG